ncbi:MAG: hypothetical protein VXX04_02335, partial [Actinomycetota bacterium]|nr:hypothetical protein [Actinomycetota bacterium]
MSGRLFGIKDMLQNDGRGGAVDHDSTLSYREALIVEATLGLDGRKPLIDQTDGEIHFRRDLRGEASCYLGRCPLVAVEASWQPDHDLDWLHLSNEFPQRCTIV